MGAVWPIARDVYGQGFQKPDRGWDACEGLGLTGVNYCSRLTTMKLNHRSRNGLEGDFHIPPALTGSCVLSPS